jgi:hypothetical protein
LWSGWSQDKDDLDHAELRNALLVFKVHIDETEPVPEPGVPVEA